MNRIRLLSEQVANQIAAGEVVERPASVVKELVENALDAGASRITVEVQAGGRSLIRVTDDGAGMSRDDALLCLERHATSKIQKAADLSVLTTLGFRGEALPSIASVSRFVLTTREQENRDGEATQLIVVGGKLVEVKTAGAPSGTIIEVRQLFFNVPARKKFMRAEETEFTHIQHYLTLAALSYPQVGFSLVKDGKIVWQLPQGKASTDASEGLCFEAVSERLHSLLGEGTPLLKVDFTAQLAEIPISALAQDAEAYQDLSTGKFQLWGFIGQPGVSRGTRDQHYTFVNRRPVENRGLNFALLEGYHTALMKGRYPVCCLFAQIDPARVDVNIHPTKREVKFHNEGELRRLTAEAVRQTLLRFHRATPNSVTAPDELRDAPTSSRAPMAAASLSRPASPPPSMQTPDLLTVPRAQPSTLAPPPQPPAKPASNPSDVFASRPVDSSSTSPAATSAFRPTTPALAAASVVQPVFVPAVGGVPLLQSHLRILGVVGKLYVILESDRGLVLMDQHAAHERVLFEQMLSRLEQGHAASQRLLLPETVELSARDAHFVRELLPTLTRLGVGLSEFGERTFLLDGVPPFVKAPDARQFVLGLLDELKAAGQSVNALRLGEESIAKTVCRYSVKANDPLRGPELEGLLHDLRQCVLPYTCPHGRPTLIEMGYRELEKRFGRTS